MSGGVRLDRDSLLVHAGAAVTVAAIEAELAREGLTLDLEGGAPERPLGAWLADGAPGSRDPWLDPVDHLVAGFEAVLANGEPLEVRPAPRRAVGPDLAALVVGARGRFATVTGAWLRVHARAPGDAGGAVRGRTDPFVHGGDPPVREDEEALLAAIARELRGG